MTTRHLEGRAALVTGGTAGIGLATGLALAGAGAHVYLTHRWSSQDEDAVRARFAAIGARAPTIIEADASRCEDTAAVMTRIRADHDRLRVLVSNAAFGHVSKGLDDLSRKALHASMRYSAWPLVEHLQQARATFGALPRYAVGISSCGPRTYMPGYAFIAAAKTAMETYCRYLSASLVREPININVVSANPVRTQALEATFGEEFAPFCERLAGEEYFTRPEDVASAVLALTSGLMDGVKGQVLELHRGCAFDDGVAGLFPRRDALGLGLVGEPVAAGQSNHEGRTR